MSLWYLSDTHFGHANIVHLTRRPFPSVRESDAHLLEAMKVVDRSGGSLLHLGDFAMNVQRLVEAGHHFLHPERHVLISGNHERTKSQSEAYRAAYGAFFGTIIGTERSWRANSLLVDDQVESQAVSVLLSHLPQEDLQGADYNLYGHVHNRYALTPELLKNEYPFLVDSGTHINVSVEVIGYQPRTLGDLLRLRESGHALR